MRSIISRGLPCGHALVQRGEMRRIFHRDFTFSLALSAENKNNTFSDFKMDNRLTLINTAIAASVWAGQEILEINFARNER